MKTTKEAVIKATSDLADEKGLNNVSLKAVAQKLNIRTPSLYNHIESLDNLLLEVAHNGMRDMNERMMKIAVGKIGKEAIKLVSIVGTASGDWTAASSAASSARKFTSSTFDSCAAVATSGMARPFSQCDTVCRDTLTSCASVSCVMPFFLRARMIFSPMFSIFCPPPQKQATYLLL